MGLIRRITDCCIVCLVLAALAAFPCGYIRALPQAGLAYESILTQQYKANRCVLDEYARASWSLARFVRVKDKRKLQKMLLDAIKGGYNTDSEFVVLPPEAAGLDYGDGISLKEALRQSFPELEYNPPLLNRLSRFVRNCHTDYAPYREALRLLLYYYDDWRQSGFLRPIALRHLSYPTSTLCAQDEAYDTKYGAAAEARMYALLGLSPEALNFHPDTSIRNLSQ